MKKRGRPAGTGGPGRYGTGVKTVVVRVPEDWKERIERVITDLPEIVKHYDERKKDTRNWVEANKLLDKLRPLLK